MDIVALGEMFMSEVFLSDNVLKEELKALFLAGSCSAFEPYPCGSTDYSSSLA